MVDSYLHLRFTTIKLFYNMTLWEKNLCTNKTKNKKRRKEISAHKKQKQNTWVKMENKERKKSFTDEIKKG